jgi:outer membrane receptor protein involved in Fe transport
MFELNDLIVPRGTSDAATIVNAAINWDRLFGTKMSGSLYAKNLLGEKYIASGLMLTTALDVSVAQKGYPRVVGFQLRVPFGAEN